MQKRNLLIIHQGALGDFVAAIPAMIRLKKNYNCVDVLCSGQLGKLAREIGLAEQCFPLEAAGFSSIYTEIVDEKVKQLLQDYVTVILFSLSRQLEQSINKIVRHNCHRIPSIPPTTECVHVADYIFKNLVERGLLHKKYTAPGTNSLTQASGTLQYQPQNPKHVLIHPGSGSVRKCWPISNFFKLETLLKAQGLHPEFVLGPAEEDMLGEIATANRNLHVLDNLPDLIGLLKSAGGYIGNDSGASHLAAFLGLPTTVIFGPADPQRWQPRGRAVAVVRPELECSPCFESGKTNCEDPECLSQTTPETVLEAFYGVYLKE